MLSMLVEVFPDNRAYSSIRDPNYRCDQIWLNLARIFRGAHIFILTISIQNNKTFEGCLFNKAINPKIGIPVFFVIAKTKIDVEVSREIQLNNYILKQIDTPLFN